MECLSQPENLGAFNAENPTWSCYNVGDASKEASVDDEYGSGVGRMRLGTSGVAVMVLAIVGVALGC